MNMHVGRGVEIRIKLFILNQLVSGRADCKRAS